MSDLDRRAVLRGTTLALGAGAAGVFAGQAVADEPRTTPSGQLYTHKVIGTWRGTVNRSDGAEENTLLSFHPGGMFTAFTDGHHIAAGTWRNDDRDRVTFALWQVLPFDLEGPPYEYKGEVRAVHNAVIDGDHLSSTGIGKALDIDGNVVGSVDVEVTARRFRLELPE